MTDAAQSAGFPATYSRLLANELQLTGDTLPALLAGTALTPDDLLSLSHTVSAADQYRLIRNALAFERQPALGLWIGCRMPLSAHGAIGMALATAPTPLEAFRVMARFGQLRVPVLTTHVSEGDHWVTLEVHSQLPMDAVGRFLIEVLLASALTFIGERGTPQLSLAFPPPDHADAYRALLGITPRFGQPTHQLRIQRSALLHPNPLHDPLLHPHALALCEQLQTPQQPDSQWQTRVTALLRQHPGRLWPLEDIARALHVAPRTLTRHLHREGHRYQQLRDQELQRQARQLLRQSDHTVTSVALMLGYQDVASFRRAFQRWTGEAPGPWRRQHERDWPEKSPD